MLSDDDAAYSALLAQLLSDSATTRNARVHSWIEHQYDFVLSEHPLVSSRSPSPSPSSSLGAHRTYSVDRPDSPLLPRFSSERPSSPCPSYDALFFPPSHSMSDDNDFEEQERVRALRFIVQEMAHSKSHIALPLTSDKPLPAPPPSPASSLTQSISSRAMRSRSSSTRISRLPSFTSTLSSDQSHPHEIPPPLPVSVIVHGEFQHDLVLSRDRPLIDGYFHTRDDSFAHSLLHSQDQDAQFLCPGSDDMDSALLPSPTFSSFSCTHSRETSSTTPCTSSPASPSCVVFSPSPCSPENIALPSSPVDDNPFSLHHSTPSYHSSVTEFTALSASPPRTNLSPASSTFPSSPAENPDTNTAPHHLRAPHSIEYSQSRWSIATTTSLTPSTAEPKLSAFLNPRAPFQDKKDKGLKTPSKRTRFISLISRLSPGRSNQSSTSTTQTGDDVEYDSANDSDTGARDRNKQGKSLGKKPSLASLGTSFSISRASFSSQRPPVPSPTEEVPPLPRAGVVAPLEVALPKLSLSKIPSRANLVNAPLSPIPQSASTITSFHSFSGISISDTSAESRASRNPTAGASRISLLPSPNKRTSLASAAGLEPMVAVNPVPASQTTVRSKSIFRLTPKPKSLKAPTIPGTKVTMTPPKLALSSNTSLSSSTTVRSRIPQAPAKFIPPAKLATVIAAQSRQAIASPAPTSKLPTPHSRIPSKVPRSATTLEKPSTESLPLSTRLPMPASGKGARVGTVKGFWKRQ